MDKGKVYSIGYTGREIKDFIIILKQYGIEYLIDVRSSPFSRFYQDYNYNILRGELKNNNIKYVFMGASLGGKPVDPSCYDSLGHVDYLLLEKTEIYKRGIARLEVALKKELKIVLMCSEINPCDCHRCKLIGRTLSLKDIDILHINKYNNIYTQEEVINSILEKQHVDMFDSDLSLEVLYKSRNSYIKK